MTKSSPAAATFAEMQLIDGIQKNLKQLDYHTPTPIQSQTIPSALDGRDVLGCAQTGTGKTAAFSIPILDYLAGDPRRAKPNRPQALILAPTRELAIQIGDSLQRYGKGLKQRHTLIFGGVGQNPQIAALRQGVHTVVATPGRLLDLMGQGHIDLRDLEVFVLDEADRMLDMGFLPDLKRIIRELPTQRQSLFFSATMPTSIQKLAGELLHDPVQVNVTPEKRSVRAIEQRLMYCVKGDKSKRLRQILDQKDVERAIVFTRTKRGANMVTRRLEDDGFKAAVIHGNKSQNARNRALDSFRADRVQILVATDVAARGIDIPEVTHVVNYDLPNEPEAYVHRIGRTGRAGATGVAISFCTEFEFDELRDIQKVIGHKIPTDAEHPLPQDFGTAVKPKKGGRGGGGGGGSRGGGRRSGSSAAGGASGHGDKPRSNKPRRSTREKAARKGSTLPGGAPPKARRRSR